MWKKIGIIVSGVGVIGAIGIIGVIFWGKQNVLGVISPLAQDYETQKIQYREIFNKKTTNTYPPNDYFPSSLLPKYIIDTLDIKAKSYCVMERQSRELLLAKNLDQELPIASVAKIMTAIVALENSSFDVELKVSSPAAAIGEAVMGLTAGERLTIEKLLYGLILPSGNDAAEVLAEGLGPGRLSFINKMNAKAQSLGLYDTYFFNPTGLDGDTKDQTSFSTCLDQLALTNYALHNSRFAEIVATSYKEITYEQDKHKAFYLNNILELDRSYPGIKGVKPGDTPFAGETLVSYAENGGKQLITVLLGTQYSKDEVVKIYDEMFMKLGVKVR